MSKCHVAAPSLYLAAASDAPGYLVASERAERVRAVLVHVWAQNGLHLIDGDVEAGWKGSLVEQLYGTGAGDTSASALFRAKAAAVIDLLMDECKYASARHAGHESLPCIEFESPTYTLEHLSRSETGNLPDAKGGYGRTRPVEGLSAVARPAPSLTSTQVVVALDAVELDQLYRGPMIVLRRGDLTGSVVATILPRRRRDDQGSVVETEFRAQDRSKSLDLLFAPIGQADRTARNEARMWPGLSSGPGEVVDAGPGSRSTYRVPSVLTQALGEFSVRSLRLHTVVNACIQRRRGCKSAEVPQWGPTIGVDASVMFDLGPGGNDPSECHAMWRLPLHSTFCRCLCAPWTNDADADADAIGGASQASVDIHCCGRHTGVGFACPIHGRSSAPTGWCVGSLTVRLKCCHPTTPTTPTKPPYAGATRPKKMVSRVDHEIVLSLGELREIEDLVRAALGLRADAPRLRALDAEERSAAVQTELRGAMDVVRDGRLRARALHHKAFARNDVRFDLDTLAKKGVLATLDARFSKILGTGGCVATFDAGERGSSFAKRGLFRLNRRASTELKRERILIVDTSQGSTNAKRPRKTLEHEQLEALYGRMMPFAA